ncbi:MULTISPECIES: DUF924 family protein [unclassified Lysobacter]|uniref:DUF924 family protein n=1 Tax=unclassified Lysobacter TaxID=2635362 RepID=UPI001BEB0D16|nr:MULTISPECIES: DUF924 family protein [unclassified Lysobacter]MBT2746037.1 DUF924 family protein [Lysobacter sp. ISL-42]MBT2752472.1 DUF924 family protein [Lysobacter sp. ISL-50]MBT2776799.1 DUF924 family protein [Lysobacter sp. ISL-54]MBT2780633.1 DUF924 family protein [Lysobacter sp. ISL-52]
MSVTAQDVVDFWRKAGPGRWFDRDDHFDQQCRSGFLDAHHAAARREHDDWVEHDAESALALLILLDQIPRNVFRGSAHSYATDPLARHYARRALELGHDRSIELALRSFFYLPFEHSEDLPDQRRSVELHRALPANADGTDAAQWAVKHLEIIERFGRFPHRNAAMGRDSSAEEQAYLDGGGFKG